MRGRQEFSGRQEFIVFCRWEFCSRQEFCPKGRRELSVARGKREFMDPFRLGIYLYFFVEIENLINIYELISVCA